MFIPILSAVTAFFAILTIVFRRRGKSFDGMLCKFISSFGFMSIAFIGFCYHMQHPFYFCLVAFGLLFGLGGDVLLGIKEIAPKYKNKLIALGTMSFMIGHIFFIAAFYREYPKFSIFPILTAVVLTAIGAITIKVFKLKVDTKMCIMLIIYLLIITFGASVSGYIYFMTKSRTFLIAFIASVLFVISDVILSFVYFTPIKSKNRLVTLELTTYYAGQLMMAATVYLI
ncbi:MAG: hypothetical protein IJF40_06765 [Clostridia bacterium]|nr:hypothetical protein [Clostridia bacterium]